MARARTLNRLREARSFAVTRFLPSRRARQCRGCEAARGQAFSNAEHETWFAPGWSVLRIRTDSRTFLVAACVAWLLAWFANALYDDRRGMRQM